MAARARVAAGFLAELGVTLEWPAVRLLRQLGGGEERANRPPGNQVLTRGLDRLFDLLASAAILAEEVRRHGRLPSHRRAPRPREPRVSCSRMPARRGERGRGGG